MAKIVALIAILTLLVAVVALVIQMGQAASPIPALQLTETVKQTMLLGEFQKVQSQLLDLSNETVALNRQLNDLERRVVALEPGQATVQLQTDLDRLWQNIVANYRIMQDLQRQQGEIAEQLAFERGSSSIPLATMTLPELPQQPEPVAVSAPPIQYVDPPAPQEPEPVEPSATAFVEPPSVPVVDEPVAPAGEPPFTFTQVEPSRDCSSGTVYGTSVQSHSQSGGCAQIGFDGCQPVRVLLDGSEIVGFDVQVRAGTLRVCTSGSHTLNIEDETGNTTASQSFSVN